MDKGMTQFSFNGLGATLPFRKEERKDLAPQISTANSICKSNPLINHPVLTCFFNLTYFPHIENSCSSSLGEISTQFSFSEKQAVDLCCREP